MSQALLAAAGVPKSEAAEIRSGAPTADAAGRHDIPAQRAGPAEQPTPAAQRGEPAGYAGEQEAEPPTVPIPAQRAQETPGPQEQQYAASGRRERSADGSAGETTRPDLPVQQAPGRHAMDMPRQRTGESDHAERSFAGPVPQDDDEDEQ